MPMLKLAFSYRDFFVLFQKIWLVIDYEHIVTDSQLLILKARFFLRKMLGTWYGPAGTRFL